MYKHMTDSIKESNNKRFVSTADKNKYDEYGNRFIRKEETFNKSEFDSIADNISVKYQDFNSDIVSVKNTKFGNVGSLEILGNTIQKVENISVNPEMEIGSIDISVGTNIDNDSCVRTRDFISVSLFDNVSCTDNDNIISANIFLYDENKNFIKTISGSTNKVRMPYGCAFIKISTISQSLLNLSINISRIELENILSVGNLLEDGTYGLNLISCGKNICDTSLVSGDIDLSTGYFINDVHTHAVSDSKIIVVPNRSYSLSVYDYIEYPQWIVVFLYDENNKLIKYIDNKNTSFKFETTDNTRYIKFKIQNNVNITSKIQIELDEASLYEPYMSSISSLNIPVELERVGEAIDRLYKRDDGVWCIEKNVSTIVLDGTEDWGYAAGDYSGLPFNKFELKIDAPYDINESNSYRFTGFCNRFTVVSGYKDLFNMNEHEMRMVYSIANKGVFFTFTPSINLIPKDNVSAWKKWVSENNIVVKYKSAVPEIIELPLDTQIYLNSFEEVTNIFVKNTNVRPILKGSIPTTIGGSISSLVEKANSIESRLSMIENIESGAKFKYVSDNGSVFIENTNQGTLDDIKIEGKTMINLLDDREYYASTGGGNSGKFTTTSGINTCTINVTEHLSDWIFINAGRVPTNLKNNTLYTIYFDKCDNVKNVLFANSSYTVIASTIPTVSNNMALIKTSSDFSDLIRDNEIIVYVDLERNVGVIRLSNMMIIEGDHTDKPLSYFKGLKSVGEGDESINILSRKEDGNLISIDNIREGNVNVTLSKDNGVITMVKSVNNDVFGAQVTIDVEPNTEYYIRLNNFKSTYPSTGKNIVIYSDKLYGTEISYIYSMEDYYKFNSLNHRKLVIGIYLSNLPENNTVSCEFIMSRCLDIYNKHISVEKSLMYKNSENIYENIDTLMSVFDAKDSIEKQVDGNWYYHKRCNKIILSSDNDWYKFTTSFDNDQVVAYYLKIQDNIPKYNIFENNVISDKFITVDPTKGTSSNSECLFMYGEGNIRWVVVKISKTTAPTLEDFKSWLINNPITIVYELKDKMVYNMAPVYIDTFNGDTFISVISNNVQPSISFTNNRYIGDVIDSLKERTRMLELTMIEKLTVFNKLMLENLYVSDSTSLRVVTYSDINQSINTVDLDIYALIYRNINSGISNYNRYEMENIIDFYTVIGKLNYTLAGKLLYMIEEQYSNIEPTE